MIHKLGKCFAWATGIVLILMVAGYFGIMNYYKKNFLVNTWVNGVYCTGKTIEEVNTELLYDAEAPFLTIIGVDGKESSFSLAEADYREDYSTGLLSEIKNQNYLIWPAYLSKEQHVNLLPLATWDEEKLKALILSTEAVKSQIRDESTVDVQIIRTDAGYELYDDMQDVFDADAFTDLVIHNLDMGIYSTNITDSGCYFDRQDTFAQAEERALWEKLEDFLTVDLVYDMGTEQIVIDKSITSDFVMTDEAGEFLLDGNGEFQMDEKGVEAFVEELGLKYNTCDTILRFEATKGEIVEVPYETYGTELDLEAEAEYLKEAFLNQSAEVHVPEYIQEAYVRGLNDIGNTYIEVDMTSQKLYGYKDGELIVETDIVTGNMKRNWDTPVGVNYVYAKQKNRILRGANYATPVDFWMPVVGNIGLHDADWRRKFGGEIYMTDGSHGCVNIPVDIMPTIYDTYEIGTPVIMFY